MNASSPGDRDLVIDQARRASTRGHQCVELDQLNAGCACAGAASHPPLTACIQKPRDFAGLLEERLKGLEPSTFCMATEISEVRHSKNPWKFGRQD